MAVTQPAFGVRLRQLRRERGMSQAELGGDQFQRLVYQPPGKW